MGRQGPVSYTHLKHASMVLQYDQTEGEAQVPEFLLEEHESYVPDFAREGDEKETTVSLVNPGALRGTAVHRVMECLDFMEMCIRDSLYIKKTPVSWKFHKAGVSLYKMYLIKSDKLRNLLPCHSSSLSLIHI